MRTSIRRGISKLLFTLGLLLLILHVILYFIMQVYVFNPYWIMLIVCLVYLIIIYKNPKDKLRLRFFIYFIALANIFTIYGFGVFCHGDYNFNIIGQSFCLNLSPILSKDFNSNQLALYLSGVVSLLIIEISYRLR